MDAYPNNIGHMCDLPPQTHFCDENGYDIVPAHTATCVINNGEESNIIEGRRVDVLKVETKITISDFLDLD